MEHRNVTEFSPKLTKHKAIKLITGFDILNATIDSFLGKPVNPIFTPPTSYTSKNHIYTEPGIFGDIVNYDELIKQGIIEDFVFFKTKGMEIGADMASRNRVGSFIVQADTKKELYEKINKAVEMLEVYDLASIM